MTKQDIPAGMSEKEYYETMADESAFLAWYKTQDLPKYETPSVTADMVAILLRRRSDKTLGHRA